MHFKIKSCLILALVFSFSKKTISQGNVFQNNNLVAGYTVGNNKLALPSYNDNGEYEGNPYFSKDWIKGSVKTTDNQEFSNKLLFMYDKVAGDLYFKKQDSATIMEADKNKIYSFTLITDKPHTFVRSEFYSVDYPGKFFEALVLNDKKYSLLKYTITSFQKPVTSKASQAMMESLSPGKYVDKVVYFIVLNKALQPVELKKKSFVKALNSSDAEKAEAYIKNNNGNFNESYIISMLTDINGSAQ